MKAQTLRTLVVCPVCRSELTWETETASCRPCGLDYPVAEGVPRLLPPESRARLQAMRESWGGRKVTTDRNRGLVRVVRAVLPPPAPFLNLVSARNLARLDSELKARGSEVLLLDLGSGEGQGAGVSRLDPHYRAERTVYLDVDAWPGVNLVGDGERLPLGDATFDAVLAKAVLEHVRDAPVVVAEARRVLKPGGLLYLEIPLLYEFHPNPGDFLRLTSQGLERLLEEFEAVETGPLVGPGNALASLLSHTLALGLSFGSLSLFKVLHPLLSWLTLPLALLDVVLVLLPGSHAVAHHLYAWARKPEPAER